MKSVYIRTTMSKQLSYIIICLFIVLVALFFILRPRPTNEVTDLRKAIPVDATFIFETHDLQALTYILRDNNQVWNELIAIPDLATADESLAFADSLTSQDPLWMAVARSGNMLLSFHPTKGGKLEFLIVSSLPREANEKRFLEYIHASYPVLGMDKKNIAGDRIYLLHFPWHGKENTLSLCFLKNILFLSSSSPLIEKALAQVKEDKPLSSEFARISLTAGKRVPANIYFSFKNMAVFLKGLCHENFTDDVAQWSGLAAWSALDINLKTNAFLLNGFTIPHESVPDLLAVFMKEKPQSFRIGEVLPANTSMFLSMAFGSPVKFRKNMDLYLKSKGLSNKRLGWQDELIQQTGSDPGEVFYPVAEHEVCFVIADFPDLTEAENRFFVMGTTGKSLTEGKLIRFIQDAQALSQEPSQPEKTEEQIDEETVLTVYSLPASQLPAYLFGDLFRGPAFRYAAFYENYLLFGNSPGALRKYVHDNILKKTLSNEVSYKEVTGYLSSEYNFYFYANILHAEALFKKYLTKDLYEAYVQYKDIFRKIRGLGCQFSADSGMLYNNIFLKYSPVYTEEAKTMWESLLDTTVLTKPQFVENHYTGEKEIVVQDALNQVYLINGAGRILWKVRLDEPILSEIFQIDFYRNGKYQLLFSTRNKIHLIDRIGNYVERYPISLRSPATNGMALFDYDRNKDYRIAVACADKKVYLYTKEGTILKDWRFEGAEHEINLPLQHIRLEDKDYLVFSDNRKTYLLDRRGSPRVTMQEPFIKSKNNGFVLEDRRNLPARLVTTDEKGTICFLYFTGTMDKVEIKSFSPEHFFDYQDINGDGAREYIFADGNVLEVYRKNKSLLFRMEFGEKITDPPNIYQFAYNDLKIGIVMPLENRIYLVNNDGSVFHGFPLQGRTQFSIGKLKRSGNSFNLIVGNEDNFLLNYSVE